MKKLFIFFVVVGVIFLSFNNEAKQRTTSKKSTKTVAKKSSPSTTKKTSATFLKKAKAGYEGDWFAGAYLGDWFGPSGGYWFTKNLVGQVGLGYDFSAGGFGIALDAQYYLKDHLQVDVPEGKLYFYGDVGLKGGFGDEFETRIRTLAGAAYFLPQHPWSFHLELGPSWQVTPNFSVGIAGGIGARYHF